MKTNEVLNNIDANILHETKALITWDTNSSD